MQVKAEASLKNKLKPAVVFYIFPLPLPLPRLCQGACQVPVGHFTSRLTVHSSF
ncbi:predicted protein [Botrytis cinerea T4]|uniref:Uncharacterized protein n=1 Tax=Botryotinia fuckeliana (strain T4) TaxID=999810 RepID=G2XYN8_BOTF4|nr:predicted protein [Botrytis cinerea T4]